MICNRCGKQVPAGSARCQNCGMPLSSVANTGMNAQEQSELPAWLESLRANERPGAPAGGQPGFSTADLIDDDDLPGWMRAEQAQDRGESDSNKHPAMRPASMSAPNTDAGVMMRPESFSARDLIDPVSLPSWMNPNQPPASPAAPAVSGGANELKAYPQGVPPQRTPGAHPYQESPAPRFSASDLIDRQSLPPWVTSGQANQPVPPLNSATWQGSPAPAAPVPPMPPRNVENGPQSGLSASSLLDVNSLPPWLRDGQQGQPGSNNMAAGSLIDMNALPSWLRAVDSQPQGQGGQMGRNAPPPLHGTAPRIESARVPSRPRAEMMPPEQSEVAANVFSSMLGVASNAPYYPAPNGGGQQSFQSAPGQPSGSLYAPPAFNSGQGIPAAQPAQGTGPGGYAGSYTNNAYQNPQNPYAANPGNNQGQQMPGAFNAGQGVPGNPANAKPGKRSFLDTIREWFHL
ncbi:MAG TPA: zinc ribbon domain-containing protein [Ktedonobacteraceae bacterium]|nr:zinc ribbon domain-containing protein [Ktedonobacteraceae bacterium]